MLTEIGPVEIEVPGYRDASFSPEVGRKRQGRLDGIDEIVLSLSARGLTTGEVAAHVAEVYGAKVSKDTISRITDKVVEEMTEWADRPWTPGVRPDLTPDLLGEPGERQDVDAGGVEVLGHLRQLLRHAVEDPVELGVNAGGVGLVARGPRVTAPAPRASTPWGARPSRFAA